MKISEILYSDLQVITVKSDVSIMIHSPIEVWHVVFRKIRLRETTFLIYGISTMMSNENQRYFESHSKDGRWEAGEELITEGEDPKFGIRKSSMGTLTDALARKMVIDCRTKEVSEAEAPLHLKILQNL